MKLLLENWRRFLKEEQEYEIYCDMDGVLVDFEKGAVEYITAALEGGRAEELKAKIGRDYITGEDLAGPTKNNDIRKYMYTRFLGKLTLDAQWSEAVGSISSS